MTKRCPRCSSRLEFYAAPKSGKLRIGLLYCTNEKCDYQENVYPSLPDPSMTTPSSSTAEMLEAIRRKCVEANPEIVSVVRGPCTMHTSCFNADCPYRIGERKVMRETRLADVLLAHEKQTINDVRYRHSSAFDIDLLGIVNNWKLCADSLDNQSPETIDFLYSLLCS